MPDCINLIHPNLLNNLPNLQEVANIIGEGSRSELVKPYGKMTLTSLATVNGDILKVEQQTSNPEGTLASADLTLNLKTGDASFVQANTLTGNHGRANVIANPLMKQIASKILADHCNIYHL